MTDLSKDSIRDLQDALVVHSGASDPLQMIRLFRLAGDFDLSESTRNHLHSGLINAVERLCQIEASKVSSVSDQSMESVASVDDVDASSLLSGDSLSYTISEDIRRGARVGIPSEEKDFRGASKEAQTSALEMRLRQLAQSGASWEKMAPLALSLFELEKTPRFAARLIELAFLHGRIHHVAELIEKFRYEAHEFYPLIHPGVRAHLVVRLFAQEFASVDLSAILYGQRDAQYLQPAERLYLLAVMLRGQDRAQAYMFFKQHQKSLLSAVQTIGPSFGLNKSVFYLKMAYVAQELGFGGEARDLLEEIPKEAPEREEALLLLLRIEGDVNRGTLSPYAAELDASPGDRTRLDRLAYYLATTRNLGGYKDKNRAGLNDILRNPLQWFGENPDIWSTLSHLITSSRDLEALLPNVWDLFRANTIHWYSPPLDSALWAGPLSMECMRPSDHYWQGVAKLHRYISTNGLDGADLWQARELVHRGRQNIASKSGLLDWGDLHREAFSRTAKSPYIPEPERVKMLAELRLASPDTGISLADVEQYLSQNPSPPMVTLDRLIQIAHTKKSLGIEFRILITRGFLCHLTNKDLGRLWEIACERKEHDLAWRIATVLRGRGGLAKVVLHPWEISGEKRSLYQILRPSWTDLCHGFAGWSKSQEKLAKCILLIGPLLPELLATFDSKSSSIRMSAAPHDSVEAQIDQNLSQLEWLPIQRRRYVLSYEHAGEDGDMPAFAQVMPANPWSMLVLRLSQRLGLNVWRWRLSFLAEQIVDVIPRLATNRALGRHSSKVGKWLRSLTPEQRTAWHDLSTICRSLSDEEALLGLGKLICRIAILMMANHAQALASLVAMRAPVAIIWDLEQFILCPFYNEYRQINGICHKVPVPNSLLALSNVVESSSRISERVSS